PTVQADALSGYLDGGLFGVGEGSQLWDHYSATIGCAESGVQFHDGDDAVASGHWFDGLIDEVSIYNRALAPEEILAVYTAGSAGKCTDLTPNTSPVLSWTDPFEMIPGIAPDTGIAGTYFEFAVVYSDSDDHPPSSGYPQVRIDYDGDGLLTGPKDAVYTMWPTGAADYIVGRKYICRTTLPVGSTYQFSFAAFDQPGDPAEGEAAWVWVSGPTVQSEPVDLYLYASDITFSNAAPSVGDTFFVSATIHNNSSSDFTDVPVDVADKFGPIGTVLLPTLPAHGTATATQGFRYSTDGYYTFRFTVDPGNAISEWDELNNTAARGVVIGEPILPGYIRLLAQTTNPNLPWGWATVSGRADYFGPDSLEPVSGATVTIDVEDYRSFVGYTKDNGDFTIGFRAPLTVGDYTMNVNVTDFTLSRDTTLTLTVVSCLQSLPDLVCSVSLSRIPTIVNLADTTSISSLYVYNLCEDTAYDFWLHLYRDGIIIDSAGPVPELAPHQTYYPPAWQNLPFQFTEVGYHSISCYADLRNTVPEDSEDNNQTTLPFHLWCDRPDFAPQPPFPQPLAYVGHPFTLHARLYNQGGIAIPDLWGVEPADSVAVRFRVTKDTLVFEQTSKHTVGAFGAWADVGFGLTFPETGPYWVAVAADPAEQIVECNEGNNETGWWIYVDDPRVNLRIEYEDVTVSDPFANADGQMVNIEAVVHNRGNGTATNVRVLFKVDTDQIGDTVIIPSIAPYSARTATSTFSWTVDRAACMITATADPANAIPESNELDNTGSVPAVFELYPVYGGPCPRQPWPMFNVCEAGVSTPVSIYARAQTGGAFNIPGIVTVHFEDRDPDGILIDLGDVMLSGFYHHHGNLPLDSLVYAFIKPGWHFVTATVDADSEYPECNENNSRTDSIWIGLLPDLMVHSEYIDPDPLNPYPGDSVTISVDIYNIGCAVADNVRVAFLMDEVALGDTVTITSIPAPPSSNNYVGIQATQKWSATDIPTGLHVVRVIADADNTIPEEDEDNNEATRAIIVGDAPDLRVEAGDISFSDYYTAAGFPTTIRAFIHNDGATAALSHVDIYHVVGSDTIVIAASDLLAISPGDSSLVSAVWIISTDSTDIHVDIVSTDPMDFNFGNNHARTIFQLLLSGDCNQDRVIDVLDVVYAVDVAFRGGVPPEPLALIDVNCDGVVSILDVVRLVNVAFRGGNPTTEFCALTPLRLSGT
ncbi:MAG TPA: CARDB domain-containing protein, partial [Acidobacteriota bacterium]|nr:CARDB domain-containing protein [Acidobacteriota bacterium]